MSRAQAKAAEGVPKGTSRSTLMSTAQLQMRRLSQWSREMRTRPSVELLSLLIMLTIVLKSFSGFSLREALPFEMNRCSDLNSLGE
jgi:hypothetical protein